jgi:hypothetical protein
MGNDELDKILDSTLTSYSQEEPRPGLGGRVLNRIRAAGVGHRFSWLRWAMAIPAFACVLFLVVTFWSKRDSVPRASKPAPVIAKTAPAAPVTPGAVQITASRRRLKHLRLPKREQFPTPTPLTTEERALLAFIAHSPKQAREMLADAKSRSQEPIQIKEIHIEPLQDGGQ